MIMYAVFIAAIFLRNDGIDKMSSFFIVSCVFAGIILVFMMATLFINSPVYNTVIEITGQGLVRTGQQWVTVRLRFDEVGKIIVKMNGTILLKKGIRSRIALYLNRYAYVDEGDILFVPLAIDNYENIVRHVRQKLDDV